MADNILNRNIWLPTEEDILSFEERGWFVTPKILDDQLLENALYGALRYYEGERDFLLPVSAGFLDWRPEQGPGIRLNDYASLQSSEIRSLLEQKCIAAIAARLIRSREIRLFHDQLLSKPPGESAIVGWHVDCSYWQTCTQSSRMLTAWIPFQDTDLESGTLTVIDGSHRWAGNEWMKTFNDTDLTNLERKINSGSEDVRKIPLVLQRGQISFHHSQTIHGSLTNNGKHLRIALAIHFQPGENNYQALTDPSGNRVLHINDVMCRKDSDGNPDYKDPEICPLLWAEDTQ